VRFSEESRLLIEHWDAVQDIMRTEQTLRTDLGRALAATEDTVRAESWWDDGWAFVRSGNAEVYIAREDWRAEDDFMILVGVERFTPGAVFGDEAPSQCYVWVSGGTKNVPIARRLVGVLDESGDALGDLDRRESSRYVAQKTLPKCLPEELAEFDDLLLSPIVGFFRHYAGLRELFDQAVAEARQVKEDHDG